MENYLLPPEAWKLATGRKKLTTDYFDWLEKQRAAFLAHAEKRHLFPGIGGMRVGEWCFEARMLFFLFCGAVAEKERTRRQACCPGE